MTKPMLITGVATVWLGLVVAGVGVGAHDGIQTGAGVVAMACGVAAVLIATGRIAATKPDTTSRDALRQQIEAEEARS